MKNLLLLTGAMLAVVLVLVSVVVADSTPTIQPLSTTFAGEQVAINNDEDVLARVGTYQDRATQNAFQNISTPQGHVGVLLRTDLKAGYIFYNIDGQPYCYSYPVTPPPAEWPPLMSYAGLDFVKTTVGANGKLANQFAASIEKYILSFSFDVETGYPALVSSSIADGMMRSQMQYINGSVDKAVFDVPGYCASPTGAPQSHPALEGIALSFKSGQPAVNFEDMVSPLTGELLPRHLRRIPTTDGDLRRYHEEDVLESQATFVAHHGHGALVQELPTHVDNRMYATPVRNQGWCGACWGFSAAAATEVVYRKALNLPPSYNVTSWFSVQNLIDCVHPGYNNGSGLIPCKGCEGGWPMTAMHYIVANGIAKDSDYHYDAVNGNTCRTKSASVSVIRPLKSAYAIPPGNVTAMMEAVHKHGALVAIILFFQVIPPNIIGNVYYTHGVYDNAACTPGLSHAVAVVGYGTEDGKDYWLVKNSMGAAWGEGGYFKIARGVNMCGIEDFPFTPVANH